MMTINQLRYFVSVASYHSFTQAAECHYMTQAAITQQIRVLEEELGMQLINRHKRPIELTPAGKVFYQEVKTILTRLDDAMAKAQEASAGTVGTVRIGYEKGYERSDLSDRLRDFHRRFPSILFTCIRADTDQLAAKLQSDELDVIFSWDGSNLRSAPGIGSRLDMHAPLTVALYLNHPLSSRKKLLRSDLRDESLLCVGSSGAGDSAADVHFKRLYEKAGFLPNILLRSSDIESLLMMVAAEEGIAIVPSYSVAKLDNADNLLFIPLEGEEEYEDIYMLWKTHRRNSALDVFEKFMGENRLLQR